MIDPLASLRGTDECVRRHTSNGNDSISSADLDSVGLAEEVPGFAVGVVHSRFAVAFRAEQETANADDVVQRKNEPGIFGNDISGDEVDLRELVGDGASVDPAVGVDVVLAVEKDGGAFHLDAVELGHDVGLVRVDDEVVALAISVGLGDGEAETGSLEGEGEFGELSATLGSEFFLIGGGNRVDGAVGFVGFRQGALCGGR